jgi:fructose-bisphosphate aldolase class I
MDGFHNLSQCEAASTETLATLFSELRRHRVHLEGLLLKASMVTPGSQCVQQAEPSRVAEATLRVLKRTLPVAVPGVVFLSGGQTPEQATNNLNAINRIQSLPWALSFSFGRALQQPVLKSWMGRDENFKIAQNALHHRAKLNSAALFGEYQIESESMLY